MEHSLLILLSVTPKLSSWLCIQENIPISPWTIPMNLFIRSNPHFQTPSLAQDWLRFGWAKAASGIAAWTLKYIEAWCWLACWRESSRGFKRVSKFLGNHYALRRSPLFPFPSHLAKFPFPSHLATFPSRGCARLELEKAATENRQMWNLQQVKMPDRYGQNGMHSALLPWDIVRSSQDSGSSCFYCANKRKQI